jgi:PAS domain S-box-containing protein
MPIPFSFSLPLKAPLYFLISSSVLAVVASIFFLSSGFTLIFQNLYYFPIIIACAFFLRRGFIFSILLIGIYGALILLFTSNTEVLVGALIRICLFLLVAGTITYISLLRYQTTADLILSEKKYRHLFNASDAGVALLEIITDESDTPVDYRFLDLNPAYERISGLLVSDVIGKTVMEVLPGTDPFWIKTFGEVAESGKTINFEKYMRELDKYVEVTAYTSEVRQVVCLIRDITERKTQEIEIRESNAYLENLITHANVPIIVWNPDFQITRINRAFELLIGRSAADVTGKRLDILFPLDKAEESMHLIQTTHRGVRWEIVEIPILHQNGTVRSVLWNSATIYGSDGVSPIATIAQGRDVTFERFLELEKERAAVQIQENIAQLAILNDGLRNPLTIIATCADMAGDEQITKSILNEVIRIDEMVHNLDREWANSEKILNYLKKHDELRSDFLPARPSRTGRFESMYSDEKVLFSPQKSSHERFIEEIQARLYSILDSIDAIIYVTDMDSYDILYLNKAARSQFGNAIGQKCYKKIHNYPDSPCPFCTNHLIVTDNVPTGIYQWEFNNSRNGRWYDCRDRAIRWTDGRLVRLEIATDITTRKQIEESLREKTNELDRFFTYSLDLICIADTSGYFHKLNPEWEATLGYSISELEGQRFLDFVHPDDLDSTIKAISTLDKQVTIFNFVNRYRHKDGSYRWIEWRSFPSGKLIYASARDITDRIAHEENIRKSEERFRTLVNAIQETMTVIDRNGTFLYANSLSAHNLSGKEPDYVIGKNIRDFVSVEKADELIRNYQTTIDSGIPFTGEVPVEMQGTLRYFYNRLIPFRFSGEGEMVVLSLSLDITEQHEMRESLAKSEEKYRRIVDTAEEGIWQIDEHKNTVYVNNRMAEMLGYIPAEMLGRKYESFIASDDLASYQMRAARQINWKNDRYEMRFIKKDNSTVWMQVSVTALNGQDGSFHGSFAMFSDITDQKKADERINLQLARLQSFLSLLNMSNAPEQELLSYTLEHSLTITESRFAFIGLLTPDEDAMIIHAWSQGAMEICSVMDKPMHFPIVKAGIWGECIRDRCPSIFNDYSALHPAKHGYPQGHVPITRYLGVPVFDGSRIVAIVAVANKETGYLEEDVDTLMTLGNMMWEIILRNRAESALRESEERFRGLIDTITSGVATYSVQNDGSSGKDYIVMDFNRMALEIEGKTKEEVVGKSLADLRPTIDDYGLIPVFQKVWKTGVPAFFPQRVYVDDKYTNWYENRIFRLKSGEIVAVYNDVTDQKLAERALAESEEQYRSVIENASEGIVVVQEGMIKYANPKALEMAQTTFEHVISQPFITFIHLDDQALVLEHYSRRIQEKETPSSYDFRVVGREGMVTWVQLSAIQILWKGNRATLNFLADISDRKQMEEALEESKKLLDITQRLAKVGGWEWDVDQQMMTWTEETYHIHGLKPGDLPAGSSEHIQSSLSCYESTDRPIILEAFRRCTEEGVPYNLEFPLTTLEGNRIWIQTMGRPVIADGRVVKVVGNIIDITDRKQAESALLQANRQLNLLTAITRHDILNKITAILGYLSLVEIKFPDPALKDYIGKIENATNSIHTQIEFTKLYQDLGTHEPQWQKLETVLPVSNMPDTIRLNADVSGIEVFADPMFERVFSNLLDNSIRHGQTVTDILVSATLSEQGLVIVWEDNGIGIEEGEKELIFERGFGKNTGLGMFLVREVLSITGLTIRECGIWGKGARFEIFAKNGTYRASVPDSGNTKNNSLNAGMR